MTYDYKFKVLLFGDKGTGKNTLAQRFLTKLFKPDIKMTIGVEFELRSLEIDEKKVLINIWHFGGEERFRFFFPQYVRGVSGVVFIYDVTNYSSLTHMDNWLRLIRKELRKENQLPILVVGNKADLTDKREVIGEEGIQFVKSRNVGGFIECSAKTGENVEEMFEAITRMMIKKYELDRIKKERTHLKKQIMICRTCGAILSEDYIFCNKCGIKL